MRNEGHKNGKNLPIFVEILAEIHFVLEGMDLLAFSSWWIALFTVMMHIIKKRLRHGKVHDLAVKQLDKKP